MNKDEILNKICYTELVYGRINKKLGLNLDQKHIEDLIFRSIKETSEGHITKKGKNYYVANERENIQITINSNTFRVITVGYLKDLK